MAAVSKQSMMSQTIYDGISVRNGTLFTGQ